MWDVDAAEYQAVDNSYEDQFGGIRMARQQASIDMLSLPIRGAEAAQ